MRNRGGRDPSAHTVDVDQHHDKYPVEAKSSEARAPRVGRKWGGAGASRLR